MPSYDFRTLSASEFEELCRDLLRAHLNCHVESFRSGRDRGIDLRYAIAGKTTIVQCKHYAGSTFSSLLSALRGETINVSRLRPDRYIVVTSQPLSPQNKDRIFSLFPGYIQSHADIIGQNDLNALLAQTLTSNVPTSSFGLAAVPSCTICSTTLPTSRPSTISIAFTVRFSSTSKIVVYRKHNPSSKNIMPW